MGRGYPPEFRRRVLDLIAGGRKVADIARDVGVSDQTIYNWRKQDRIDRGLEPGLTGTELEEPGQGPPPDRGAGAALGRVLLLATSACRRRRRGALREGDGRAGGFRPRGTVFPGWQGPEQC